MRAVPAGWVPPSSSQPRCGGAEPQSAGAHRAVLGSHLNVHGGGAGPDRTAHAGRREAGEHCDKHQGGPENGEQHHPPGVVHGSVRPQEADPARDAGGEERGEQQVGPGCGEVEPWRGGIGLRGDGEPAGADAEQGCEQGRQQAEGDGGLLHRTPERPAPEAGEAGAGEDEMRQMWNGVGREQRRRGGDQADIGEERQQGRGEEHQPGKRKKEVQAALRVSHTLAGAQAAAKGGHRVAGEAHHAAEPACTLAGVVQQALRRQPGGKRQVQKGAAPAGAVEGEAGGHVFDEGSAGEAADGFQGGASEEGAGAGAEGRAQGVVAVLDSVVKQVLLRCFAVCGGQALEDVRCGLEMRELYEAELGLGEERAGG